MQPTRIDDPDDPRLALYRDLPDAVLRRRIEGGHGVFVVEGARAVRVLLGTTFPVLSVLLPVRPARRAGRRGPGRSSSGARPSTSADRAALDRIAGFPIHRGVLALAQRRPEPEPMALLAQVGAAVIVEGVNDHENLGAIFRNAAALGAGAVLLDPGLLRPAVPPLGASVGRAGAAGPVRPAYTVAGGRAPTWPRPASPSWPSIRARRSASSPWLR